MLAARKLHPKSPQSDFRRNSSQSRVNKAIVDGIALDSDGRLLKTLPTGLFKSLANTDDINKLREGEWDAIDPVGGFVHLSPDGNWSVQGTYLKALKGSRILSLLGFSILRTMLLRMAITSGVEAAFSAIRMLLEHFAIICALLMTIILQETYLGIEREQCFNYDKDDCVRGFARECVCSAQVDSATISLILCIVNVTYCIIIIALMTFRPIETGAYRMYTEFYRMVIIPIMLMISAFISFGWAYSTRILRQSFDSTGGKHPMGGNLGGTSTAMALLLFLFWPSLCFAVLFMAGWTTITELKTRDLTGSCFSDSFLQATGVYPTLKPVSVSPHHPVDA